MKECPVCHAVTEEKSACPICGETLTYVEENRSETRERLCWNRYTVRYLLRELWFPLLAVLVSVIAICVRWPLSPMWEQVTETVDGVAMQITRRASNEQYLWLTLVLAVLSLIAALLRRRSAWWLQWKYSEEYAAWQAAAAKYVLGIPAIVLTVLLMLMAK